MEVVVLIPSAVDISVGNGGSVSHSTNTSCHCTNTSRHHDGTNTNSHDTNTSCHGTNKSLWHECKLPRATLLSGEDVWIKSSPDSGMTVSFIITLAFFSVCRIFEPATLVVIAVLLTATLLWFLVGHLCQFTLRQLLKYRRFLYEPRG